MKAKGTVMRDGARGTKIRTDFGPDHSTVKKDSSEMRSGKMGGSQTNLSHSLSGSSAKQRGK